MSQLGGTTARGADHDKASEGTELGHVCTRTASTRLRDTTITMWKESIDEELIVELVRPNFFGKPCAMKHSTQGVGNSGIRPFAWSILKGGIRSSRAHDITKFLKEVKNARVPCHLPAFIHLRIEGGGRLRSKLREPTITPGERRDLAGGGHTPKKITEMVSNEEVRSLAVEANKFLEMSRVLCTLDNESEVH
jgi:hypothetical protein